MGGGDAISLGWKAGVTNEYDYPIVSTFRENKYGQPSGQRKTNEKRYWPLLPGQLTFYFVCLGGGAVGGFSEKVKKVFFGKNADISLRKKAFLWVKKPTKVNCKNAPLYLKTKLQLRLVK